MVDCCPEIAVPTLLISGRHDEATPVTVQPFADLIPNVRWEMFEDSSHLPHLEEPERYLEALTRPARGRHARATRVDVVRYLHDS